MLLSEFQILSAEQWNFSELICMQLNKGLSQQLESESQMISKGNINYQRDKIMEV